MSIDRYLRPRDLVPHPRLQEHHALVLGVGAIGRPVALLLAAMGIPSLTLVDHDRVEEHNLPVQGYVEADLGRLKVEAAAEACRGLNTSVEVTVLPERFRRSFASDVRLNPHRRRLVVFACVDSIETLGLIFEALRSRAEMLVDGRMAGETIRVLAVVEPARDEGYAKTLFSSSEAFPAPCTGRSTLYAATIAAGLMVGRFAARLRDQPVTPDILLNLAADELIVMAS
jgi:sulfur carrier protein ThiS adenylyltransferase